MLKRSLTAASLSLVLAVHALATVPKERSSGILSDSAPAACNAFGLTPEAAARERREMARRDLEAQEALRSAQRLRSLALKAINPLMPSGVTPPAMYISGSELVRASIGTGIVVTTAVIDANEQLNERRYYLYDPEGRLLAETESTTGANPAIEWEYIWFNDEPLAQVNAKTGEIAYYFNDHLGTPIIQTNQQGQVIWHAEYEPFGKIFAMRVGEGRHQPLRLPGQIADVDSPEPEVYYNVFRWYRSSFGRYTQADPIGMQGGSNLFAYALDNPINYDDPLGLRVRMCCRIIPFTVSVGNALRMMPPGASFPPQRHCFFQFDNSTNNDPLGLHGTQTMGGYVRAWFGRDRGTVLTDADFDRGRRTSDVCGPWAQDPCNDVDQCVRNAGSNYPSPSQYSLLGPNSNTFAFTVARQCYVRPPHPVDAPGWNAAPPQP